jgi:dolichyl-phosphate beta-glucosyltransferase
MAKPHLSVVIPCYNELKNLERGVLDEVDRFLKKQKYTSEVIVSDDEPTDGSREFLRKYVKKHPKFIHLQNKHGGKPFAVRAGIEKTNGKIVLFTDMDQSTPLEEITKLLPYFDKGFDVVIGSRGQTREGFPIMRRLASWAFLTFRQSLLLRDIKDTQCGFKAFKTEVANDLFEQLSVFKVQKKGKGWTVGAFDVELLFIAQKRGHRIKEVVVNWLDRDESETKGGLKSRFIKESKQMFKEILRVKVFDLKGDYRL